VTLTDDVREFYAGYFTGPHFPPRPWPEADEHAANVKLATMMAELSPPVDP
jgi:hypothetical protein